MSDTATASIEVLDVTMLPGRGRLQGLAMVELTLDGVAIILQGVRILRRADGLSFVEPPGHRHAGGDMVPAVALPVELEEAVARAVLERAGELAVVHDAFSAVVRPPYKAAYGRGEGGTQGSIVAPSS